MIKGDIQREILVERARSMRKTPTEAEKRLWTQLRKRSVHGFKFKRQEIIDPYIVDFVCHSIKLIVEIDGDSHELAWEKDSKRQQYLEQKGFTVLRFQNKAVLFDIESVVRTIEYRCLSAIKPETS